MKRIVGILAAVVMLFFALPALGEAASPTTAPTTTEAPVASTGTSPDELLAQWNQLGDQLRALGNYPFVELKKGDTGNEVRALQTRLAELGYYKKEVVDNFGKGTLNAVKLFEKVNKLKVNGVASVKDQQLLYSDKAAPYEGGSSSGPSASKKQTNSTADATSGATS